MHCTRVGCGKPPIEHSSTPPHPGLTTDCEGYLFEQGTEDGPDGPVFTGGGGSGGGGGASDTWG